MQFVAIHPSRRTIEAVKAEDPKQLWETFGHKDGADFGNVAVGYQIIVDEWSMVRDAKDQNYFSINTNLYAGSCVIFGYDPQGNTRSVPDDFYTQLFDVIKFYNSADEVEQMITSKKIPRPHLADQSGTVLWTWQPNQVGQIPAVKDMVNKFFEDRFEEFAKGVFKKRRMKL